jgi:hypothetical protein
VAAPSGRKPSSVNPGFLRADAGTRTPDPFITSEVLYQLSYVGAIDATGDLASILSLHTGLVDSEWAALASALGLR